jgi:octaprenyl-diphosphate synthase
MRAMSFQLPGPISEALTAMDAIVRREASRGLGLGDQIAQHALKEGGKRLRPTLILLAERIARPAPGEKPAPEPLLEVAAAIELIHTASLLHDDVVDAAIARRGQPSVNALWGDRASVLVGDVLWSAASRLIVQTGNLELIDIFATAANQTAEGELLELDAERAGRTDDATYLAIAEGKTAALFVAAARAGAILASADRATEKWLASYARAVGIAFQLADDAIDGTREDRARGFAGALIERRGGLDATRSLARRYAEEAKQHLDPLPPGIWRDALAALADHAAMRSV